MTRKQLFISIKNSTRRLKCFHIYYRHKCTGNILVSPTSSHVTDKVSITGNGFAPSSPITIKTTMLCESEQMHFKSSGYYVTSENGTFDTSASESFGGTYTGVDGMGLFWSMQAMKGYDNRFQMTNAATPLYYHFSVLDGHTEEPNDDNIICKTIHKRNFLSEDVKRKEIRENNVNGTLFVPSSGDGPFPAIITMYGTLKRKHVIEDAASIFASNGFVTLALAYFGYDGLPNGFVKEPVRMELFEDAIHYLSSLDYVNSDAIGAYGISKGGEICVAMASLSLPVKAIVCVNNSIRSFSYTTYRDRTFPPAKLDLSLITTLPDGSRSLKNCASKITDGEPSLYPIEDSNAEILYIAGLDDGCFGVEGHADFFQRKMDAFKKTNYEVVKYDGLGHLVDAPFAPPCTLSRNVLSDGFFYYGGGDIRLHASQVVKVWDKVISFFKKVLENE